VSTKNLQKEKCFLIINTLLYIINGNSYIH